MGCAFPFLVACRQEGVKQRRLKDSFPCRRIEIAQLQIRWFAIIGEQAGKTPSRSGFTAGPVRPEPDNDRCRIARGERIRRTKAMPSSAALVETRNPPHSACRWW